MDENQLKFIKNKIENCILIGNPGCGKTTTIIEYCIHKYENNLIKSFLNFLIISFSKDATNDFISRGQKSKYPSLFNTNNIKTIHSLAYKILSYYNNIEKTTSINILVLSAYKLIQSKTTSELTNIKFLSNIKFIIIDEAQDINENQYKLACILCNKLNISLILVGDPNQNIYQFQGGSDEYLLNHSNKIFTLNYNYRSSVQLVNFLNYIRPHKGFPEMRTPKKENEKKPLLYVNDIYNILAHIKKQLLVSKYNLEDIAIIGPVKLSKEILKNNVSDYESIGLQLICNFLNENNIKFIKHFNDINDNNFKNFNEIKKIKNHVNILTSHSSKGLEFKKVLVVNYQLQTFSTKITNYEYEQFKYLWYVTLSRAIHKLIIYIRINHDIFYDIFDVPKNLYLTNNINKLKNKYNLQNKLKNTDKPPKYYEITKIINDLSYLTEEKMYSFLHDFKYTITKKQIYSIDNNNIIEHNKYSALYGVFIELLFKAYYYKHNKKLNEFIDIQLNKHQNIYVIEKKDKFNIKIYKSLISKGIICNKILYFIDNNNLTINEQNFINYYKKNVINDNQNIEIHIENILFKHDLNYLKDLCYLLLLNENFELNIFNIALYFYQLNNECKYLLNYNFEKHIESLKNYFNYINEYSLSKFINNELIFDINCNNINLNLIGSIDFINKKGIINEIKFTKSFDEKNILQTVLYYHCLYNEWDKKKKLVILNLFQGYKYTINFSNNTNWWLNCFISEMLNYKLDKCIFYFNDNKIIEYNSKYIFVNTEDNIMKILNICNLPLFIAYNGDLHEFKYIYNIYNKNKNDNKTDKIIKVLNLKNIDFNFNNKKYNFLDLYNNTFCYDLNLDQKYLY